jgi:hypothetical protein
LGTRVRNINEVHDEIRRSILSGIVYLRCIIIFLFRTLKRKRCVHNNSDRVSYFEAKITTYKVFRKMSGPENDELVSL